jgi:hypothetical protein
MIMTKQTNQLRWTLCNNIHGNNINYNELKNMENAGALVKITQYTKITLKLV